MIALHTLAWLSGAAFSAGFVDSIAGGGGMINIPALLLAGLPAHDVLGTNKLAGSFGTLNASRVFLRKKILSPKPWYLGMVMMFIGSIFGVFTAHLMSTARLQKLLPWLILCVAGYFIFPRSSSKQSYEESIPKPNFWIVAILGLVMGWYDGFFGPGTGAILTAFAMLLFNLPLLKSMVVARLLNLSGNLGALLFFVVLGNVNYTIGLSMAIANIAGSQVGAHSAIKLGVNYIRYFFILVVSIIAVRLIYTNG